MLSPKIALLIFILLAGFVFFFLLDFANIHLPYTVKYLAFAIAIVLYVVLARILKFGREHSVEES
jgi:hypothetical protein